MCPITFNHMSLGVLTTHHSIIGVCCRSVTELDPLTLVRWKILKIQNVVGNYIDWNQHHILHPATSTRPLPCNSQTQTLNHGHHAIYQAAYTITVTVVGVCPLTKGGRVMSTYVQKVWHGYTPGWACTPLQGNTVHYSQIQTSMWKK